jgi:hypothetical protein
MPVQKRDAHGAMRMARAQRDFPTNSGMQKRQEAESHVEFEGVS